MDISRLQNILKERFLEEDITKGPFFLLTVLLAEIGELADAIKEHRLETIEEELADSLFTLLCLGNLYDINIENMINRKYILRTDEDIKKSWRKDAPIKEIQGFIENLKHK